MIIIISFFRFSTHCVENVWVVVIKCDKVIKIGLPKALTISFCQAFRQILHHFLTILSPFVFQYLMLNAQTQQPVTLNQCFVDGTIGRNLCLFNYSTGILIENILHGREVSASMVGIGLNLNQTEFPPDLPNPVSLSLLTGRRYDPEKELALFMRILEDCAEKTNTAEGRRYLDRMFDKYMFRLPS